MLVTVNLLFSLGGSSHLKLCVPLKGALGQPILRLRSRWLRTPRQARLPAATSGGAWRACGH
eukprot:1369142-Alexandrium_andersonii.AAC.1